MTGLNELASKVKNEEKYIIKFEANHGKSGPFKMVIMSWIV